MSESYMRESYVLNEWIQQRELQRDYYFPDEWLQHMRNKRTIPEIMELKKNSLEAIRMVSEYNKADKGTKQPIEDIILEQWKLGDLGIYSLCREDDTLLLCPCSYWVDAIDCITIFDPKRREI